MNTMKKMALPILCGVSLSMIGLTPNAAQAQDWHRDHHQAYQNYKNHQSSVQNNKNNMRNLTIGAGAVAAYGLLKHNTTATVLGAAGAALAGSQYEKARKEQSQNQNDRNYHRRYHRH